MWPNYKLRIEELLDKASFFEFAGYSRTAGWVRYFAERLAETEPVAKLEGDFDDTVKTFQSEFVRGEASRSLLFSIIRTAFLASLSSPEKRTKVLALLPLFEEATRNSQNILPIGEAFNPFLAQGNVKMRYHAMCLLYLFNTEGVFDTATRIIYAMALIGLEQPVPINLPEMSLSNVRKGLLELQVPVDVIFEGWVDGRVRNAIAHSRFSYDAVTMKTRFRDIRTANREPYDASFTIFEFSELCIKLDNPFNLIMNLLFVLRIMDLIFTPGIEDAGKKLIFKRWRIAPQ